METVAEALREIGVEPIFADALMTAGWSPAESARREIGRADIVIADLTEKNENVMYELGYAHALKKPVLPLIQEGAVRVPADLGGYFFIVYDPSDPEKLRHYVQKWVDQYLKR